jgi:hypothetical protein
MPRHRLVVAGDDLHRDAVLDQRFEGRDRVQIAL